MTILQVPETADVLQSSEPIKVLALNGGGVRGLFTITLLAEL